MTSMPHYVLKSGLTIVRAYTMYRPMRVFTVLGALLIFLGSLPGLRFLYLYFFVDRVGHVQSLILAAILIIVGVQTLLIGVVADLISFNRQIMEEAVYRLRKLEAGGKSAAAIDDVTEGRKPSGEPRSSGAPAERSREKPAVK